MSLSKELDRETLIFLDKTKGYITLKTIKDYLNKPLEQAILTTYIAMIIIIAIAVVVLNDKHDIIIEQNKQLLTNDSIIIHHHLYQDSLYRSHLEECSFISRDEVEVGYNNYFRKKDVTHDLASIK